MDTTMLSAVALQLVDPWRVTEAEFRDTDAGGRELHITIGYGPGSRFHCPEAGCGETSCPVHDTMERTWRHLNFFQYKAFIHASVPRVACPEHGVRTVTVEYLIRCGPLLLRLGAITGFDGYCVSGPWLLRFEAMAG